jgi:predicted  nucleic acid-binding Zn-ribbon protein
MKGGFSMDTPAPPPAPDSLAIKQRLAAIEQHIKDMRRDVKDTLDLIEGLRENCTRLETKLAAAEREHALLLRETRQ